jgi:hypothetical protein
MSFTVRENGSNRRKFPDEFGNASHLFLHQSGSGDILEKNFDYFRYTGCCLTRIYCTMYVLSTSLELENTNT